jgi:hypothetical protein
MPVRIHFLVITNRFMTIGQQPADQLVVLASNLSIQSTLTVWVPHLDSNAAVWVKVLSSNKNNSLREDLPV